MLNFLVETKKEYITQLQNAIYFKIYEGLSSLYKKSMEKTTEEEVLKNFQKFLKKIPKWETNFIENETNRIVIDKHEMIDNLLKAVIKSNVILLTFDPRGKVKQINPEIYDKIKLHQFIHEVYIECARELWNNPFLFYHKYNALELKRNQREIFTIIKNSVEEAIRKLLPMNQILDIYLGNNFTPTEVVEKITEMNPNIYNHNIPNPNMPNNNIPNNNISNPNIPNPNMNVQQPLQNMNGGHVMKDSIQSIMERNGVVITESNEKTNNFIKQVQQEEMTAEKTKTDRTMEQSIDSKIKQILDKDLNDTEGDASLSYKPENTENYQEVFGNTESEKQQEEHKSNVTQNTNNSKQNTEMSVNSINTVEKQNLMKKNKFFNNYLNF